MSVNTKPVGQHYFHHTSGLFQDDSAPIPGSAAVTELFYKHDKQCKPDAKDIPITRS